MSGFAKSDCCNTNLTGVEGLTQKLTASFIAQAQTWSTQLWIICNSQKRSTQLCIMPTRKQTYLKKSCFRQVNYLSVLGFIFVSLLLLLPCIILSIYISMCEFILSQAQWWSSFWPGLIDGRGGVGEILGCYFYYYDLLPALLPIFVSIRIIYNYKVLW